MEEFISSFHSLSGITIGERRKNLFLLLNETRRNKFSGLDFSLLQPNTPLEENFKVDVLIYFRRIPDLVEVLKSENPVLITRVLKLGSWFWEEAFQNITGEQLVTSLFPYISFNVKLKIINKLALHLKNPQQGDNYFEAIEKKYGLYLASKLLPSCSADMITNGMQGSRSILTPRQFIIVIKKYPMLTELLLRKIKSSGLQSDYKIVFMYVAQHDMLLFLKLCKEFKLAYRLGWRITEKFVEKNRQDVIQNPDEYYKVLHNKQIAKSLNQDFKYLYFNLFPASLRQFYTPTVLSVIQLLPAKMQNVNLLLTTFEKAYGSSLWDYPKEYITLELLDMLPLNEREDKVKAEYRPSSITEEKWICYWKTEKSIPYLKKAISLCSDIRKRADLIALLVETCKINEDKVALADVCKYVITRHRNDSLPVRLACLRTIRKHFKLEYLEEQHWTPINELIQIFTMNNESFYEDNAFFLDYIHYSLINNLPVEEHLTKWLKDRNGILNLFIENPQYEKQCLLMFAELIPEVHKDKELEEQNIYFLNCLIKWNKRHPQDPFSLFAYTDAFGSVIRILKDEDSISSITCIIRYCVLTEPYSEQRTELLNMFLAKHVNVNIMTWLIQYEPLTVIQNIQIIRRSLLVYNARQKSFFGRRCRYYTHIDLPQKIVNICLTTLQDKVESYQYDYMTANAIAALSHLMNGDEFKKFIIPYYPTTLRADAKSDEGQKLYKLQQNIGFCLKNLVPSSLALESILIFCKGDFLKLIQGSLYSVSGHVNEDKLPSFFNELSGRAVSIRKHAMHLTFRVLDKPQIYSILNKFMEAEKNPSIRKFIFKSIFNFFLINPDDYSWELVKLNVNAVDVDDKEALEILMEIDKIPRKYFVQYFVFTWEFLSKLPDPENDNIHKKGTLLRSLEADVIQLLPKEFCDTVIKNYFFNCFDGSLTGFQSTVQTFTCRYIIYCDSQTEQEERLKSNFAILCDYVKKTYHNSDVRSGAHNCVANFLKEFCLDYLSDKLRDTQILIKFADLWNGFFEPHEALSEYLHLQFTFIYIDKLPLPQIGMKLANLCDSLASTYGPCVIDMFSKKIIFFTHYFLTGSDDVLEENRFILIESLIQPNSSNNCLILVILLLNTYTATIPKTEVKYKAIIEMLEKKSDLLIKLYLNQHFIQTTSLDYH